MRSLRLLLLTLSLLPLAVRANPIDVELSSPHLVKSIETGTAALQLRLEMIERAQTSIDVEYFIYHNSDATRIFTEALVQKKLANPEIRIRLLVDYFGLSKSIDPYFAHALIDRGIEVRYYNPSFLLNVARVTHRNHRKIVLVDQREALVGGRNMGDEYYDLRPRYNFMDRDLWVRGDIAEHIGTSFQNFWDSGRTKLPKKPRKPTKSPGDRTSSSYDHQLRVHERKLREAVEFASPFSPEKTNDARLLALRAQFKAKGSPLLEDEPAYEVKRIRFIADGPDWKQNFHHVTGPLYYSYLKNAQKTVSIEVPYFYLQENEENTFRDLKGRAVEVNLLLNAKRASNEYVVNYISLLEGLKFSKLGFNLFLNNGDAQDPAVLVDVPRDARSIWMVHAKTMVVDDHLTWIGTLNMDPRSVQRLNAELALVIDDPVFAGVVKAHVHQRYAKSTPVLEGTYIDGDRVVDPAQHDNLWDLIRSINTVPFYIFENQI